MNEAAMAEIAAAYEAGLYNEVLEMVQEAGAVPGSRWWAPTRFWEGSALEALGQREAASRAWQEARGDPSADEWDPLLTMKVSANLSRQRPSSLSEEDTRILRDELVVLLDGGARGGSSSLGLANLAYEQIRTWFDADRSNDVAIVAQALLAYVGKHRDVLPAKQVWRTRLYDLLVGLQLSLSEPVDARFTELVSGDPCGIEVLEDWLAGLEELGERAPTDLSVLAGLMLGLALNECSETTRALAYVRKAIDRARGSDTPTIGPLLAQLIELQSSLQAAAT